MWAILLVFAVLLRSHSCSNFQPVRRYHPATKFNSNTQDDLVTSENFQYAYGGGESQGVVDYSHSHDSTFNNEHDQQGGADQTHPLMVSPEHHQTTGFGQHLPSGLGQDPRYPTGFDHGHQQPVSSFGESLLQPTGFDQNAGGLVSGPGDQQHTGEVDLTVAGSELGYPEHTGYSSYSYGPPPPPGYGPSSLPSLPAITTPPPVQEAKQSPGYTYYYLGRHLWYIPLYFSIYFILYVGALVLKSVARHKILFPDNLKVAAQQGRALRQLQQGTEKYYM